MLDVDPANRRLSEFEKVERAMKIRRLRRVRHELYLRKAACYLNIRVAFMLLCILTIVAVVLQLTFSKSHWSLGWFALRNDRSSWQEPDIHVHHKTLGHPAELRNHMDDNNILLYEKHHHSHVVAYHNSTVAIGCAVTSRSLGNITASNVRYRFPFLRTFMPSFCRTASRSYDYHIYLSYDEGDPFFAIVSNFNAFHRSFGEVRAEQCAAHLNVSLHYVECEHTGRPAWAQNDAMMEAYIDHMVYYYRVNDDTNLLTPGWTEAFVAGLAQYDPPDLGVVGPRHIGGHAAILTYDFVHRTHIDIFGFYYPRTFTDWWADNWISTVYGSRRSDRLANVRIHHTLEKGTRYNVKVTKVDHLKHEVEKGKLTVESYLRMLDQLKEHPVLADGKRVISMSLWGHDPRYTFGAVRNAQLVGRVFPGWTLRVYVERPLANGSTLHPAVPQRILRKLRLQGARLVFVDVAESRLPPLMWRFLVADDLSVDYFIVRDADSRLSGRDAMAVADWVRRGTPLHCIRDHPTHRTHPLLGGLWGGRPQALAQLLWAPWRSLMRGYRTTYALDMFFLSNTIWTKLKTHVYCHDSVSCSDWPGAHPFPVARRGTEHVGQVFDALGTPRKVDIDILKHTPPNERCDPISNLTTISPVHV